MSKIDSSLKRKMAIGYALGIVPESVLYNMFYTYFVVLLTDVARVRPILAEIIGFISILWYGQTDPFIGHITDKPNSHKRDRRCATFR